MPPPPIKVLHIDDDRPHHELVKAQLAQFSDDIVFRRVDSRKAALAALEEDVYDGILTDEQMPASAGRELLLELRRRANLIPFVILAELDGEEGTSAKVKAVLDDDFHVLIDHFHFDLLNYWLHRLDDAYRRLVQADRLTAEMLGAAPQKIAAWREVAKTLTSRERQILELIGAGRSNREIADELFISYKTAKNHVSNIFAKLGIHTRAEAIRFVMTVKISGG